MACAENRTARERHYLASMQTTERDTRAQRAAESSEQQKHRSTQSKTQWRPVSRQQQIQQNAKSKCKNGKKRATMKIRSKTKATTCFCVCVMRAMCGEKVVCSVCSVLYGVVLVVVVNLSCASVIGCCRFLSVGCWLCCCAVVLMC